MNLSDVMRYVGQTLSMLALGMAIALLISQEPSYGLAIATSLTALVGLLVVMAAVFVSNYKLDKVIISENEMTYRYLKQTLRKNCRKQARKEGLTNRYLATQRAVFTYLAVSELGVDPYRAQGDFLKIEHRYRRHS